MFRVGLTGGIGSGKSTVAKIFEVLGIPVYYADQQTKLLMNSDPDIREMIISHFGKDSYNADKKLNRGYIASVVFNDPEKLSLLNSITHPAAIKDADRWMKRQSGLYSIKEAALIFESGSDAYLDFVIGVYSPLPLRIQRVKERDGLSEEEIHQRISRQMNEEEKMKRCDYVITNDERSFLIQQVLDLHKVLTAEAQRAQRT